MLFFLFLGDLSFEEFSKTSLVEELMASDELEADEEETAADDEIAEKEDISADHGGHSSDDPSTGTTGQAENFAAELSNIRNVRKRNLMATSMLVSNRIFENFTLSKTGPQLHVYCTTLSIHGPILQYNKLF